jgi:hypothetical protein
MMKKTSSRLLDKISDFFSRRKGLLALLGISLVTLNFILELLGENWFTRTDIFLHLGIIVAILGYMLAWAL